MDQIDTVRAFLAVAEQGGFTQGAARLGLSKALVSKHVAALEARVGVRLLNRTTRRVSLTEAGLAFRARALEAVATWEAMMEAPAEETGQPSGLLRIAGPRVFGERVLAGLVAEFLAEQPRLRVDLALEERQVDIVGEGFDLALRIGVLEDSALVAVPLAPFPYVLCAAPAYLAVRGTPAVPEDLSAHDCVVNTPVAPNGQWSFLRDDRLERVSVPARVRVNGDGPAADFVRAGLGIGLVFRRPVEAELADGRLVPVLEAFHAYDRKVHAVVPHRVGMPAKTRLFLDFLRSRLR
ncbi:MAG: LysR substrate-binding domain-containing protein [Pseudomonadota bacterium]